MTPPVIHLAALGTILVGTIALCVRRYARPSVRRVVLASVCGAGVAFFVAPFGMHMCYEGSPFQQWALPALCVTAVILWVGDMRLRLVAISGLVAAAIYLSMNFATVVHQRDYVGRAAPPAHVAGSMGIPEWFTPFTGFYRRGETRQPVDPKARAAFEAP